MRTWAAAIVVMGMVSGCNYGPSEFACGPDKLCGSNGTCEANGFCSFPDAACPSGRRYGDLGGPSAGKCVAGAQPEQDASIDASPDARTCFGTAPFTICLAAAPTTPMMISAPTAIDTSTSSMCVATTSGASKYCVIAATSISVDATLRATGQKPLVLLASDAVTLNATVDVGSHRGATPELGAGADPATCDAGTAPMTDGESSGGGAGGSFLGLGGAGGTGGFGAASGTPGAEVSAISELRGGCPGQDGQGSTPTPGGHGGGVVYVIAGSTITIIGDINAAGEGGGGGGSGGDNCSVLPTSAGGGGGAGGMIGFDAPTVVGSGLILANGGGGGGGCAKGFAGDPGADPMAVTAAMGGAGGDVGIGGAGGGGSAGAAAGPGAAGGGGATCGACRASGGGGGGGAGLVKAAATANLGTKVSPLPTP